MEKHILVVDDDPVLRTLLQAVLENSGYGSETAENGGEALTKLESGHYDAVVLDYMMPGANGLMILERIQRRHPAIPVVMLTGHTSGQVAARALAAGARACLFKPFDCVEFEQVLARSVEMVP